MITKSTLTALKNAWFALSQIIVASNHLQEINSEINLSKDSPFDQRIEEALFLTSNCLFTALGFNEEGLSLLKQRLEANFEFLARSAGAKYSCIVIQGKSIKRIIVFNDFQLILTPQRAIKKPLR